MKYVRLFEESLIGSKTDDFKAAIDMKNAVDEEDSEVNLKQELQKNDDFSNAVLQSEVSEAQINENLSSMTIEELNDRKKHYIKIKYSTSTHKSEKDMAHKMIISIEKEIASRKTNEDVTGSFETDRPKITKHDVYAYLRHSHVKAHNYYQVDPYRVRVTFKGLSPEDLHMIKKSLSNFELQVNPDWSNPNTITVEYKPGITIDDDGRIHQEYATSFESRALSYESFLEKKR